MKNGMEGSFAETVISFSQNGEKRWSRCSRRTLAFADIAGAISRLTFCRSLHLVPPVETETEECRDQDKAPLSRPSTSQNLKKLR